MSSRTSRVGVTSLMLAGALACAPGCGGGTGGAGGAGGAAGAGGGGGSPSDGGIDAGGTGGAFDGAGNIYVTGQTLGTFPGAAANKASIDVFVIEVGPSGGVISSWQRGSPEDDVSAAIAVDPCGTVVVGGYTTGALIDGQPNLGHRDMFLVKADLR